MLEAITAKMELMFDRIREARREEEIKNMNGIQLSQIHEKTTTTFYFDFSILRKFIQSNRRAE